MVAADDFASFSDSTKELAGVDASDCKAASELLVSRAAGTAGAAASAFVEVTGPASADGDVFCAVPFDGVVADAAEAEPPACSVEAEAGAGGIGAVD